MASSHPNVDHLAAAEYAPDLYHAHSIVEPIDGLDAITEAHIEQYRQLGFLSVANAFSPGQVADAREGLRDLIMGKVPEFTEVQFEASARERLDQLTDEQREAAVRKLMGFCDYDRRLGAMVGDESLLDIVRELMHDRTPRCFQEMALLKPPGGREKPWHQDQAYFNLKLGEPVVGVWIALDEATPENGCMHVIPGTHRDGPVVHFARRDWQICDTHVRTDQIVACPLPPGGLLLFDGLLHHGTPMNPTNQRRRALQFHYCPEDAEWGDDDSAKTIFGSKGKDVEC
jgi:phytanoyl-CoA hydroxylase